MTVASLLQRGRQATLRARIASQLLTPEQVAALEAIEDPSELERRRVVLLRQH